MLLSLYLAVLDDQSNEEQFIDVYNTYKRLVYHTAYKIMGDSYLAEDVLQEVFLYVAKNFSKIHRENCHELAAYLVSCSRSRAYDMLRKQREEPLEEVPDAPDDAPVPDDAVTAKGIRPLERFDLYHRKESHALRFSCFNGNFGRNVPRFFSESN